MTIREKIASKKRELGEKRTKLNKLVKETRASLEGDGEGGSGGMSSEEVSKAKEAITVAEEDVKTLQEDLNSLESISPLLQETPDEEEPAEGEETDADEEKEPAAEGVDPAKKGVAPAKDGVMPAKKRSRIIRAEERGLVPKMHNIEVSDRRKSSNVRSFEKYIRAKGELRADQGIMSSDASFGAVVPIQYLNAADQPLPPNSLAPLVNKIAVNFRTGHYPIFKRQTVGMEKVNQLDPNALTANPSVIDVVYDLDTYRQQINIAQEAIDDMNVDITAKVANFINEQKYLTEQYSIGNIMAVGDADHSVTPVTVHDIDDIKMQSNVNLNIAYTNRYFVATQSAFQVLDTVKDAMGRPIVQGSLTDATKRSLFGYPLVVVQDVAMGEAGEKHLWLGDPKAYVAYFHKTDTTARWFAGYNYEMQLYAFYRADFKVADGEAGISMVLGDDFTTQYELAQTTTQA